MQDDLKPRDFMRRTLYVSSALLIFIGLFSLQFGMGHDALAATCLSIPLSTLYIKQNRVKLIPSYIVVDLHLFFWLIFSASMLYRTDYIFKSPLIMTGFLIAVAALRKYNFTVCNDANRIN
jgi:hypothetical protein